MTTMTSLGPALVALGWFASAAFWSLNLHAALEPPNIIWINCEDLDDTLGYYGYVEASTPHLDALTEESILFRNAFANAPICAPARNCLITGMYPTSLGGQHLRCEIALPPEVKPFPLHLKEVGYFVTNHSKTDYNFPPDGIYDYWRKDLAPWRKRPQPDQPFFSFFVLGTTHEGPGNFRDRYERAVHDLPPDQRHDPARAQVPPYFPDTPMMRELLARYDDLVSSMDLQVGEIIDRLKDDGLWENTIVWFFSDHGHGLPRHKRWLLDSGLRVPLLIRIPPAYHHLAGDFQSGDRSRQLVSFVDFAPTVLSLAEITPPEVMQGRSFPGAQPDPPREFIYGARDRADDMFEVSRAVHDGRFLYVRHFLHRQPYLQGSRIFGDQKESLAELRRARDAGQLNAHSSQIFVENKPREELYDLENDPHEIHNLASDSAHAGRRAAMKAELLRWITAHRDTGFLAESEYTRRARQAGCSIYEMAQRPDLYDLDKVLRAALEESPSLPHADSGVLYWRLVHRDPALTDRATLGQLVRHANPSVRVAAAKVACLQGHTDLGLPLLTELVASEDLRLALEAARAVYEIGAAARPAADRLEEIRKGLESTDPDARRRYRDFNYASFTGWALEAALVHCGAADWNDFN